MLPPRLMPALNHLLSCIAVRSPLLSTQPTPPAAPPKQILSSASAGGGEEPALDIEAVQAQLRGALLKLQYSDAYLRKLPAGCSFEVAAYTTAARGGVGAVPLAEWAEEQAGPGHLELRQVGGLGCMEMEGGFGGRCHLWP